MSYFANVIDTKQSYDQFARLRCSNPSTLFDSKLLFDADTYQWDDQQISGTAASTYNANQASVTLSTTAAVGVRVRQTKRRFPYQPGKSQLIFLTGVLNAAQASATKRCGYFDDNNGLFFEMNSTSIAVGRRTKTSGSPVDTLVQQSAWNIDKMDGTGASGITLDFTKTQIFVIDFEWLGVGSVRFGFAVNGLIYYVHQLNNANSLTTVYMSTPNLPLRWEVRTTGAVSASLTAICSTVISEGGLQETGKVFNVDTGTTPLTTNNNNSLYGLIAVRLASTRLDAVLLLQSLAVVCNSTSTYRWVLLLNPTVVGTALSFSTVTGTSAEKATPTNATTFTGGTELISGFAQSSNDSSLSLPVPSLALIGSTIAGVSDIVVLAVQRIQGTSETFYGSLNLREV